MKLRRILSMVLILMMAAGVLACAHAEAVMTGSYTLEENLYSTLNDETGLLYVRDKQTGFYSLRTADGQVLTTEPYIYMDDTTPLDSYNNCAMFQVAVQEGLNIFGLIDANGKLVVPMQYGDVEVISDRWQLGVKLVEATAENYDYSGSGGKFYLVEAYDVYYCGALAGTLGRLDYYGSYARGSYLYVRNQEQDYVYYDSTLTPSGYESKYPSYSEYEDCGNKIMHRGSNQQAFVPGCTLTVDDVEIAYCVIDGYVVDVQGNQLGAVNPDYADNVGDFIGDYAHFSENRKYGLIDKTGREVLPYEYEFPSSGNNGYFEGGYQILNKDGKIGFANASGEITCEFKYAESILDSVYKMPLTSLTDLEGKKIVLSGAVGELPDHYDDVRIVSGSPVFAALDANGNAGIVDLYGNTLIPFDGSYDDIYDFTISLDGTVILAQDVDRNYNVFTFEYSDAAPTAAAQEAPAAEAAPADSWTCACGATNAGKFCSECGATRPVEEPAPADGSWTCTCGSVNTGKFCPECGTPRPEEKLVCAGCGFEPAEGTAPKFCSECGTAF